MLGELPYARAKGQPGGNLDKKLNRLSARRVATVKEPGRHADGGDLDLVVDKGGASDGASCFNSMGSSTKQVQGVCPQFR